MRRPATKLASALLALAAGISPQPAQTSASFKLTESVLDAGGDPQNGSFAASASFRLRLDAIGGGVEAVPAGSAGYHLGSGFAAAYPPPGEVVNVRWVSPTGLVWDAEKSVGTYDVYRGSVGAFSGFGTCLVSGLTAESATATADPALSKAFFYLVTAENRLTEEGVKGFTSSGALRSNAAPCP